MHIDLEDAVFSQTQIAECTSADPRTVENYIQYGYVVPSRIDGRRRFTGFDLIKNEFLIRLASFGLAPRKGTQIVDLILYKDQHALAEDARSIQLDPHWPGKGTRRVQFDIVRDPDGSARLLNEGEINPEATTFIFPSQIFARAVLQKAAGALGLRD